MNETLTLPRHALVALKRSIDPHSSDPKRYEILRDDLDAFWLTVLEADAAAPQPPEQGEGK